MIVTSVKQAKNSNAKRSPPRKHNNFDREDRELKFVPLDLTQVASEGQFEGYASLFNTRDMVKDVVRRGAFSTSLKRSGLKGVKMLFQHDPAQVIGVWDKIVEDQKGLYVRGQLMTEIAKANEILTLMRAGALDGLSIGFKARRAYRNNRNGVRELYQVDLYEISVVTFPMHPEARVSAVKNRPFATGFPTVREFERWLVRDAGFTRQQAQLAIAKGFKSLAHMRDADSKTQNQLLAHRLRRATRNLK